MRRRFVGLVALLAGSAAMVSPGGAADLDRPVRHPRIIAGIGPDDAPPQALPRCRTIAVPEVNLSYEVVRYRTQTICYSRGMLADQRAP